MYMRVKQLSNPIPMTNRENAKTGKLYEKKVRTPATAQNMLHKMRAGRRPNRSAVYPEMIPPMKAPAKNKD